MLGTKVSRLPDSRAIFCVWVIANKMKRFYDIDDIEKFFFGEPPRCDVVETYPECYFRRKRNKSRVIIAQKFFLRQCFRNKWCNCTKYSNHVFGVCAFSSRRGKSLSNRKCRTESLFPRARAQRDRQDHAYHDIWKNIVCRRVLRRLSPQLMTYQRRPIRFP